MHITLESDFFELFPDAQIGIIIAKNLNNEQQNIEISRLLTEAHEKAQKHLINPEFSQNEVVAQWRKAFQKFKTKKGARSSIEALLKRVNQGKQLGEISPLVDLYNAISLEFGVPCGGEDLDTFVGDMRLTLAEGGEEFITYGSDVSEPPYPNEVIYKDDAGAICRCWNWRESVRTMLTEQTKNAVFVIEAADENGKEQIQLAIQELSKRLESLVGASTETYLLNQSNPTIEIQ